MAKTENKKMTKKECAKKLIELREIAEINIVSSLWSNPQLYITYDELNINKFGFNKAKVFFEIGKDIVVKEGKELEPITVDMYLSKHDKLKEKYVEYGGHDIFEVSEYVNNNNTQSYINDLNKYVVLMDMLKEGFPVAENFSDYMDMTTEEIYQEQEVLLNHIFANVEMNDRDVVKGVSFEIDNLIEELDSGSRVGLPFYNMPLYNRETMGLNMGNLYLVAGFSGSGKSSLIRNAMLPSIIEYDEKALMIINEEDLSAVQQNLLVFVANNIYKKPLQKYVLNRGNFTPEIKELLFNCANWIKEHDDKIKVLALSSYNCDNVVKIIKKYAHLGFKYFILDTFKQSSNAKKDMWASMMEDSIKLYDLIKPANLNVCLVITAQLKKSASRNKELTQGDLGLSTNVIDVCSMAFFTRKLRTEELPKGSSELKVFKKEGKSGKTHVPVTLDETKHYIVGSFMKNRFGSCDLSIVFEHDLSRNIINEVGYCLPVD